MSLDPELAGRQFPPTAAVEVTEQRLADFAAASGTPWKAGDPAPATFPIVVAFAAMQELMADPSVGIELHRVVHGQQKFAHVRQVRAGDRLSATLTVSSVRHLGGADVIATSSAITDADGALVCTADATLLHNGGGE